MDDRHAQFLIAVGDLCTAAGLAGLEVQVRPREGHGGSARGVPTAPSSPAGEQHQADDTGYPRTLAVGDHIVNLETIEACTVFAPSRERDA